MARIPQEITDAELGVLDQLWQQGKANIRQIMEVLYPGGTASHYATVQKLLERLEAKGYVSRDRRSAVHVFHALLSRDDLIVHELQNMVDKLCGGSLTPVLTNLVRGRRFSESERCSLQAMLAEVEPAHEPSSGALSLNGKRFVSPPAQR